MKKVSLKRIALGMASVVVVGALITCIGVYYIIQSKAQVEGEYFDSNGVRIHYTVQGEGEAVILVHGYAVNQDMNWRSPGVLDALAEDYKVIALDNRGHGLSEVPRGVEAYGDEMPRDIVRLLDHLRIEKAHVIGYSMGGYITLKLITMFPERLLSAAPCGMAWREVTEEDLQKVEHIAASMESGNALGPLLTLLGADIDTDSLKLRFVQFVFNHLQDTQALAEVMRAMPELNVTEAQLRANKVPTLTILGTEDPLAEGADEMTKIMGNHSLVYVEGGGHINTPSRPEFLEALRDFLAKHAELAQAA